MIQMESKLKLITERAKQDKSLKFTSLVHLINEESLAACYLALKKNKASGVDGVTVESYGEDLEDNLKDLVQRLKSKKYRPQPVRRVYIPKPGKVEKRPLGIPAVEDKIVQMVLKRILEAIYEQDFLECSNGFRPERGCHTAIDQLDKVVMSKPINYVVEVDIEKFFDNVRHYWLLRCLEERISDPNLLWLVRKFLKAGIMEDGMFIGSKQGTPQGGIVSPILSNIYLHYVLDLWFERTYKKKARGYVQLIRYCDDFVVVCESRKDAEDFLTQLGDRLNKFGLNISRDKTRMVEFGRRVWKKTKVNNKNGSTFNFLGFTHYHATSRRGNFIMGHKTSKQSLSRKLKDTNLWLKRVRSYLPLKVWWPVLKAKLVGHYNYFGVSGNFRCLKQFYNQVFWLAYKWINRRSQKKSMKFEKYKQYLQWYPLPQPRICYNLYTLSPIR